MRPVLRRLRQALLTPVLSSLEALRHVAALRLQSQLHEELEGIKARLRAQTPTNPALWGQKVYAQTDEDGILAEIVRRLPAPAAQTVIEIGCADGTENNSHALLLQGWRGVWCDAAGAHIRAIEAALGGLRFPRLWVRRAFLDAGNTNAFLQESCDFLDTAEPDLLSVDIDGNDMAVTQAALAACRPRVLCVEYNAAFPPPIRLTMTYAPGHHWMADDYQGTSLQAWVDALAPTYRLVACGLSGANAFFVRQDQAAGFTTYPVGALYQPPRYHLVALTAGHGPTLKWLRQVVNP